MENSGSDDVVPQVDHNYAEPYPLRYATALLFLLSFPLAIVSIFAFGQIYSFIHGVSIFALIFSPTAGSGLPFLEYDLPVLVVILVLASAVTVVLHELTHGLLMQWYGKDVSYGFIPSKGAFYAASFEQFMTREESIVTALAPIVLLSFVGIVLLGMTSPSVGLAVFFALVVNATGGVGDFYLVWRLLRLPPGSLIYDASIDTSYIYESTR